MQASSAVHVRIIHTRLHERHMQALSCTQTHVCIMPLNVTLAYHSLINRTGSSVFQGECQGTTIKCGFNSSTVDSSYMYRIVIIKEPSTGSNGTCIYRYLMKITDSIIQQ